LLCLSIPNHCLNSTQDSLHGRTDNDKDDKKITILLLLTMIMNTFIRHNKQTLKHEKVKKKNEK